MNPIVKILIAADFFFFGAVGLIQPIFAVFIKEHLIGGSLASAGIATTIFLLVKAIFQIPIARFTDREPANVREFWTMMLGHLIFVFTPLFYYSITTVDQLYAVQALYGLGSALAFPGWVAIFTKFADHKHAAFSWSVHSTTSVLVMAATASLGGWFGQNYGFPALMLFVGLLKLFGFFGLMGLILFYKELRDIAPPGLRSIHDRFWEMVGRHKQPPLPPTAPPPGPLPPK